MNQRAIILPMLLVILTLLLICIVPLHEGVIQVLRYKADENLSQKASNLALSIPLAEAFNFRGPAGTRISHKCFSKFVKRNRVSLERTFCASYNNPLPHLLLEPLLDSSKVKDLKSLPTLNWHKIFVEPKDCSPSGAAEISEFPIKLSSRSAISSRFCEIHGNITRSSVAINANLKVVKTVTLDDSTSLTSRGFIKSEVRIVLNGGHSMIAAAGDLLISKLTATNASEITLISATGNVSLDSVEGPIQIRVFAAGDANIPKNSKFVNYGFEDLKLDFMPISLG